MVGITALIVTSVSVERVLVICMDSGLVGGLLFVARAALLGWRFPCVCAFGGFLLLFMIAYAILAIASLCNTLRESE